MALNTLYKAKRIFPAYTVISFLCLILDSSIYSILLSTDLPIPISATLGYLFGLILSYVMLLRIGINREKDSKLVKRTVYAVTGAIGLAVTFLSSLFTSSYLTQNPVIIKIISVGLSFFAVFILRTTYVFE